MPTQDQKEKAATHVDVEHLDVDDVCTASTLADLADNLGFRANSQTSETASPTRTTRAYHHRSGSTCMRMGGGTIP